jgi:hypothetical protein
LTVTDSYTPTDKLAKTDSTMFPTAEKLIYFNIAKNLLYALQTLDQQDRQEEEWTKTTVAGQRDYLEKSRIHHVNWVKIDYGNGFITARYFSEADLIAQFGIDFQPSLDSWDGGDPIYYYKGSHLFISPAPTAAQAGVDRLKASLECYPADMTTGADVIPVPIAFEHIPAVYAAWRYFDNNGEDVAASRRLVELPAGMVHVELDTVNPRARQAELISGFPNDDGSSY